MDNARLIAKWRATHEGQVLTEPILKEILGVDDLCKVDLCNADLSGGKFPWINFEGADLRGANFSHADLTGALIDDTNLSAVNFEGCNLTEIQGCGTNLNHINLRDANVTGESHIRALYGIWPYDPVFFYPTPRGWKISIGDKTGSLEDMQGVCDSNNPTMWWWWVMDVEEIEEKRPQLQAVIDICKKIQEVNSDEVNDLEMQWGKF